MYFDTPREPRRFLQEKNFALRIRKIDDKHWITLKGPSKENGHDNVVERLEYEQQWSMGALDNIIHQLMVNIGDIELRNVEKYSDDPVAVLKDMGLEEIQKRNNYRKFIDIAKPGDKEDIIVAELDIDHVRYHFNSCKVFFYNIEIEKKDTTQNHSVVENIVVNLLSKYGNNILRKWNYGKLALGKGIEKLRDENKLSGLVDSNNYLKCSALNIIETYIQNRAV
jgi:hypothetical protein